MEPALVRFPERFTVGVNAAFISSVVPVGTTRLFKLPACVCVRVVGCDEGESVVVVVEVDVTVVVEVAAAV